MTYSRAFADNYFHESLDVFMAMWRDDSKCMLQMALDEREKRQRKIAREENSMQSPPEEDLR